MAEKILIIEDEKKISDIVKSYLERDGFNVTVAETGREALKLIKDKFDLIILDLKLPDIDGEEICSTIRKTSDIPIIMLTARGQGQDKKTGSDVGADGYITKPFDGKLLLDEIKKHLL